MKRTPAVSALRVLVVAAGMCAVVAAAYERSDRSRDDLQVQSAKTAAFRSGGLLEAARVTGTFSRVVPYYEGSPASLYQLVAFSDIVVTVVISTNRSVLDADGTMIFMGIRGSVVESIKGRATGEVSFVVPGGRVVAPDGSQAQVSVQGFARPLPGGRYLVFLRKKGRTFEPTFGPLGIYELSGTDRPILPSGSHDSSFAALLRREAVHETQFLQTVRNLSDATAQSGLPGVAPMTPVTR